MHVTIAEPIRQNPQLAKAVDEANNILTHELGKASERVTAEWSFTDNNGHPPFLDLKLIDHAEQITRRFIPEELVQPTRLDRTLRRAWGDLLAIRSANQIEHLLQAVQQLDREVN